MYSDSLSRRISCLEYSTCKKLDMKPQIVFENGRNIRVCAERPIDTVYTVKGEKLRNASGVAVLSTSGQDFYCTLKNGKVHVSTKKFGGETLQVVGENVIQLAQHANGVLLLESDGTLSALDYDGAFTTRAVATDVAYVDGSADFVVYVQHDGTLVCASANGLCPPTEDLKGRVHEVVSANAEGITFRLKSGALYYRHNGVWNFDEEAVQVGVLNGSVYRLLRNDALLRDGVEVDRDVESVLITDKEVNVRHMDEVRPNVKKVSADRQTLEETGSYFRSPLTVEYARTMALDEHGCRSGQTLQDGACAYQHAAACSQCERGEHRQEQVLVSAVIIGLSVIALLLPLWRCLR